MLKALQLALRSAQSHISLRVARHACSSRFCQQAFVSLPTQPPTHPPTPFFFYFPARFLFEFLDFPHSKPACVASVRIGRRPSMNQSEISRPLGTVTFDMLVLALGEEDDWLEVQYACLVVL